MNASVKLKLAEVEWGKEQHEREPDRRASSSSYRVFQVILKGLGFIREMGGHFEGFFRYVIISFAVLNSHFGY